jgi:hypothetical protein
MKKTFWLAAALVVAGATACENRDRNAPGETTTTSAQHGDRIRDDLDQAGRELSTAAGKAADEAKRAAQKLDEVKIGASACEPSAKNGACDGGAGVSIRTGH